MAHNDERTALSKHLLQRRQSATYTGVISYLTILIEGHVEIHAHDCPFTGKLVIINCHSF